MMAWRNLDRRLLCGLLYAAAAAAADRDARRRRPSDPCRRGIHKSLMVFAGWRISRREGAEGTGREPAGTATTVVGAGPRGNGMVMGALGDLTSLATLAVGRRAVIARIGRAADGTPAGDLERRLLEIGFEEGREVEVRHLGPFGGDPIAVRVDTAVVAVRRKEAAFVLVSPLATV